jgi:hypothetical protein
MAHRILKHQISEDGWVSQYSVHGCSNCIQIAATPRTHCTAVPLQNRDVCFRIKLAARTRMYLYQIQILSSSPQKAKV